MKPLVQTAAILLACAGLWLAPATPARAADCFNCSKESTGKCEGANQCRGSRDDCRKAGCIITGTASCSSAANVKICLSAGEWNDPWADGEPLSTPADPARHACFGH